MYLYLKKREISNTYLRAPAAACLTSMLGSPKRGTTLLTTPVLTIKYGECSSSASAAKVFSPMTRSSTIALDSWKMVNSGLAILYTTLEALK